ncbi:hypothetical protein [Stigmatella aurantiaca]|uniref:Conserved uncharacterized protein n=1 Tax=Stigmatella aurantiaca (strain DW4/3-1) TaxID=378806 RepID=Q092L2_STIAD|nr:hypothetical protein [Stigmatella aurantiaca]ADO74228.1 conserved uncharacterized protein [Stigmatella aurantiaca DW4/3-1]EAU66640.1 hypothetical protein STIAU_7845 [Stigmatella aurantiaca DW4/3-1]
MSETRELRNKLEAAQTELRRSKTHLDKLRGHHERERVSLQQALHEARREVAGLHQRHDELLKAREQQQMEAALAQAMPLVLGPPALGPPTALVALVRRPEPLEQAIPILSRLTRLPPADVRLRIAMILPAVLVRVPIAETDALLKALHSEGFLAVSSEVPSRLAEGIMTVRRFTLDEQGIQLEDRRGQRQHVAYAGLRLLVRGRRLTPSVEKRLEWSLPEPRPLGGRRGFSVQELKQREIKKEEHNQFLWAYFEELRVAFSQGTQFQSMGAQRGATLYESLQNLTAALRQRAAQAVVDERLMGMPRFSLPLVEEERGQELFADLLFQAVKRQGWP